MILCQKDKHVISLSMAAAAFSGAADNQLLIGNYKLCSTNGSVRCWGGEVQPSGVSGLHICVWGSGSLPVEKAACAMLSWRKSSHRAVDQTQTLDSFTRLFSSGWSYVNSCGWLTSSSITESHVAVCLRLISQSVWEETDEAAVCSSVCEEMKGSLTDWTDGSSEFRGLTLCSHQMNVVLFQC